MFEYNGAPASLHAEELDKSLREKQAMLTDFIKRIANGAIRSQGIKSRISSEIGEKAYRSTISLGILFIFLALIITGLITRNIAGSIRRLKVATKMIAKGEFEDLPQS